MVLTTILQWIRVLHQAIVSPMFVVLRAALGLQVKSQTIEDEFHQAKLEDAKRYGAGERTLTSRFVMPSLKDYEQYFRNLNSGRTDQVVEWIAVASPRFKGIETVADVLAEKHDAMRVRGDPERLLVEIDADHRYLGGSMFLRYIEAMLGTPPRKLPPSSPLYGLFCAVRTLPHTLRFMRKPKHGVPNGPNQHLLKRYTVRAAEGSNRRFAAYFAMLKDAMLALGKGGADAPLCVGFSVVFDGQPRVVNNVGVIVLEMYAQTTEAQFARLFEGAGAQAMGSNALCVTGIGRLLGNGQSFRQRLDVVCTALCVDDDALGAEVTAPPDGAEPLMTADCAPNQVTVPPTEPLMTADCAPNQVTVHPTALVYERAYVSLFSRLKADGSASVTAAVTTNIELDAHGWTSAGFALRTGGGVKSGAV